MKKISFVAVFAALLTFSCSESESSNGNPLVPAESSSSLELDSVGSSAEISSSSRGGASDSKEISSSRRNDTSSSVGNSSSRKKNVSSSSKEKSSSSQGDSSSSTASSSSSKKVESSSSKEKSSSSQEDSSSSTASSSSSKKVESSSSKEKSSSSQEDSSSSSVKSSSSSATIPSKLYDCEKYKCVTTKHLNPDIDYGEYLDVRDSQVYRTVLIGEQMWMAQNLNFNIKGSYCYSNDSLNCITKGRMYSWFLAREVCPIGWRLPDTTDFRILGDFAEQNNGGIPVGNSLKSGKTDVFGFASLVNGGYQTGKNGKFSQNDKQFYWTDTEDAEDEDYAKVRFLQNTGNLSYETFRKTWSLSVRCIKE